jgi:hypothetical protein
VIEREKIVLNGEHFMGFGFCILAYIYVTEKDQNHFDVLPEGWIKVTHESGIPVYLHRKSRVCTVSRPYSLGTGSVRVFFLSSRLNLNLLMNHFFIFRNITFHLMLYLACTTQS